MEYQATVCIDGTKEDVWRVITNIEGSVETLRAIEQIDVLENPASGLVGLKWRETRTMFGRTATEVIWNDFISVIPATEEPPRSEFKEISALVRDSSAGITIDQPVGERC